MKQLNNEYFEIQRLPTDLMVDRCILNIITQKIIDIDK